MPDVPPSFFFPQFIYSAWCHMVWNTSLASSGQLSWLCPLPVSRAPPALSLAGPEKLKSPWLSINITQQQPKTSVCYQHCSHTKSKTQSRYLVEHQDSQEVDLRILENSSGDHVFVRKYVQRQFYVLLSEEIETRTPESDQKTLY